MERTCVVARQLTVEEIDVARASAEFILVLRPAHGTLFENSIARCDVAAGAADHVIDVVRIAGKRHFVYGSLQQHVINNGLPRKTAWGLDGILHLGDFFRRDSTHLFDVFRAELFHQLFGGLHAHFNGNVMRKATKAACALQNGTLNLAARQIGRNKRLHAHAACRLACCRDAVRVSTERRNVLVYPVDCCNLVVNSVIAADALGVFGIELRVRKEAECADTVVDGDEHYAVFRKLLAVELLFRAAAVHERTAVNPEEHGQLIARLRRCRRPDVQIQAVFALL